MTLKLVVTTNVDGDVFELLLKNRKCRVGRRHDNDLRIRETYISGYHAEINRNADGEYELVDLGSSNGTFLNGRRVEKPETIKAGDYIKFGILKVAVAQHREAEDGPTIVSLKDRPSFARKSEELTSSVTIETKTGSVSSLASVSTATAPTTTRSTGALRGPLEPLLEAEKERSARLEKDLEALRSECASLREDLRKRESELNASNNGATEQLDRQRSDWEARLFDLENDLSRERSESTALAEKLESICAEARAARDEASARRTEVRTLRKKLEETTRTASESAERERTELASQLAAAEEELFEARAHAEEQARVSDDILAKERSEWEARLSRLESELSEKNRETQSLAAELEKSESAAKQVKDEAMGNEQTLASLTVELEEAKRECAANLRKEKSEWEARRKQLEEELSGFRREAEQAQHVVTSREDEIAVLQSRLEEEGKTARKLERESQSRISDLKTEIESLQSVLGGTEIDAALEAANVASLTSTVSALTRELDESRESKTETENRVAELERLLRDRERVEKERNSLVRTWEDTKAALANREAQLSTLKSELGEQASERTFAEIEGALKSKLSELETLLAAEKVRAGDAECRNETLRRETESLRAELDAARETEEQWKGRNEEISRNNGQLRAELNRESAEAEQLRSELNAAREKSHTLLAEVEKLQQALASRGRELIEKDQEQARSDNDIIQRLKRELNEALAAKEHAEQKQSEIEKEKHALSGSFERLKAQLDAAEGEHRETRERENELIHSKGLLARRLEKAEASNSELAARIHEEASAALASHNLIEKLEAQIRENESQAMRREQEQVQELQSEIDRLKRLVVEEERKRERLGEELNLMIEGKRGAEREVVRLNEHIVEMESETVSMRELLQKNERQRSDLSVRLSEQTNLADTHRQSADEIRREFEITVSRFQVAETKLLEKHRCEIDSLLDELRLEKARKEKLQANLEHTRMGMSEALRHAWEDSRKAQAKLIVEGNAKLSGIEDELTRVMREREHIELSRNRLEDDLNDREEKIERMSEVIEDLETQIRDERDARNKVLSHLQLTREGFSNSLFSNWKHLGQTKTSLEAERTSRERAEEEALRAKEELARISTEAEDTENRLRTELDEWEERFNRLREEKVTLASEDSNLRKIRDQIVEATAKKKEIESELGDLSRGIKDFRSRHGELQAQKEKLLGEREELKAVLNTSRHELFSLQRRFSESKAQEEKLAEAIASAERRIHSLKKLESEMEHAVERKRQQNILSRNGVFSETISSGAHTNGEFSKKEFYRKLIAKLDLLDDLTIRYSNTWRYPKVAEQLTLLKRSFLDLLSDHSVQQFDLEPGTLVSIEERKRIKLIPHRDPNAKSGANGKNGHDSRVVRTVRPGYLFQDGAQNVIIRKAEVIIG